MMRIISGLCWVLITIAAIPMIFSSQNVYGAQFLSRAVRVGDSKASVVTTHNFSFNIGSVGTVGSLKLQYCANSPLIVLPCTAPGGLNVASTVLASQTGEVGFSISGLSNANTIVLTRPPVLTSIVPSTYNFSNVTNPSATSSSVYVRISSYASIDTTGAYIDEGTVAFSTANNVTVSGYVPPYLTFCVGVTVAGNCSSANGELLSFGELSRSNPKFLTSQFAGATNDPGGYSTFLNGTTMTSGTNTITPLLAPSTSQLGVSQFGLNLRSNTAPAVGAEASGIGVSSIDPLFAQPNNFTFQNHVLTFSTTTTDFNLFTVSYLVNVSSNQPPGVYTTTLTYIATAAF